MTTPTKANETTQTTSVKNRPEGEAGRDQATGPEGNGTSAVESRLQELARAQEELTQELRRLVARELTTDGRVDDPERAGQLVSAARADLLAELRREQQEQARRELAEAGRGGEEAVTGVVRSLVTVLRTVVPAAIARPEDLIEATYALADQGLRVGRRLALTVGGSARELTRAA